jgi:hypothetical protein
VDASVSAKTAGMLSWTTSSRPRSNARDACFRSQGAPSQGRPGGWRAPGDALRNLGGVELWHIVSRRPRPPRPARPHSWRRGQPRCPCRRQAADVRQRPPPPDTPNPTLTHATAPPQSLRKRPVAHPQTICSRHAPKAHQNGQNHRHEPPASSLLSPSFASLRSHRGDRICTCDRPAPSLSDAAPLGAQGPCLLGFGASECA